MRRILAKYKNGNYYVTLFSDGTKIKRTDDDFFVADFPDSIDLKITDYCENACPMCHESSGASGSHGDLDDSIVDTFFRGMEVAIGGGDPLTHPNLVPFLQKLKERGVIANVTVNVSTLKKKRDLVERLIKEELVHGVGVSCMRYDEEAVEFAKTHSNVVLHLINGVFPVDDYRRAYGKGLKILILGYKNFGRGKAYYSPEISETMRSTKAALKEILDGFFVVSFDNLALEQLNVKNAIGAKLFDEIYMGDDGDASMYVDLVKKEFALSSTSVERYPLESTLEACFNRLKDHRRNH